MVQLVVPAPVNELLWQETAATVGCTTEAVVPIKLIDVVLALEPSDAVRVTVCDDDTDATLAAKPTLVAPEGTTTETGTLIEELLLASLTETPELVAGALMLTVQLSVPAPLIDELAQLSPVSEAVAWVEPLPCSLIQPDVVLVLLIAVTAISPTSSMVDLGSKRTCATRLAPAGRIAGNDPDCTVKAVLELLS